MSDTSTLVQTLRDQGQAHFDAVGFPTRKHEDWREFDPAAISSQSWSVPAPGHARDQDLEPYMIADLDAHRFVIVDGVLDETRSNISGLPQGVTLTSLQHACETHADLVAPHLGKIVSPQRDAFTALNTANLDHGVFLHVPNHASLDKPVEIIFVSSPQPGATMTHPRVLAVIEDDASAELIEQHIGLDNENVYLTNAVTEIHVGDRGTVVHSLIEREGKQARSIATLASRQGEASDFTSHTLLLGGKVVRNNCLPSINGENALSTLNGLYLPHDEQLMDNRMFVHHTHPNCESRQYYTGVLSGKSKGVFGGRIKVERPAQQTDAVQSSRNLLLSDDAHAHNQPQLEIFADDVKCTHGSTTGQLDEEAIFYLQARGIDRDVAQGLLVYSFAAESLDRINNQPLRNHLARLLISQMQLGPQVEALLD